MPLFRRQAKKNREVEAVPFASNSLEYIKHHGLRALCGLLMDRHSGCTVCPFCGNPDPQSEVIVQVEGQTDATTGEPLVALYFSRAASPDIGAAYSIEDWASRLRFTEAVPIRKAVVNLLDDGTYHAEYGPIANPTEGNHATGMLNREEWFLYFRCEPEPKHTQWQYWESDITLGQQVVPEFCCLRMNGEWWIVDRDRERGMFQQVAALTVADSPYHDGDQPGR